MTGAADCAYGTDLQDLEMDGCLQRSTISAAGLELGNAATLQHAGGAL